MKNKLLPALILCIAGTANAQTRYITDANIQAQFTGYKEVYFGDHLPETRVYFVKFEDPDLEGQTFCSPDGTACAIELADWQRHHVNAACETLLHEMSHESVWSQTHNLKGIEIEDAHGIHWLREMHRLMAAGAFDDIL
ncbi:MAG: hypothetical protein OK457_00625 [Thaumarchaeota archaeon]|nr:hypothetical protein [Nitrososphaerota archaeon]